MNEHAKHRERLKNRFATQGLDGFESHQVLELLLFYAIPRVDTNPIAHRLLDRFGSITGVLEASPEELKEIEGIGDNAANFLKLILSLTRRIGLEQFPEKQRFSTIQEVGEYLINLFKGETVEKSYLLCFNAKMELLKCALLAEGTSCGVSVSPRTIVDVSMQTKAAAIILAHNHTNGFCTPSDEDMDTTHQLKALMRTLQINFLEHIVVANGEYVPLLSVASKARTEGVPFKKF